MKRHLAFLLLALSSLSLPAQSAGGYIGVSKVNGVWWFTAPDGQPFLSRGLDTIEFSQDIIEHTDISPLGITNQKKYGDKAHWSEAVGQRMFSYGFNTAGAWSDAVFAGLKIDDAHALAGAHVLDFGAHFVARQYADEGWKHNAAFADVFDPAFAQMCEETAQVACRKEAANPWLLGWFSDNELRWGPDYRSKEELLITFLNQPPKTAGHHAALLLLQSRHADIAQLNTAWKTNFASWDALDNAGTITAPYVTSSVGAQNVAGVRKANDPAAQAFLDDCDAFMGELAEEYFRITTTAIHHADPNHLTLGCRFSVPPPPPVLWAAGKYLDVVSFNCYDNSPAEKLRLYAAGTGRPLLIGEFSFRGRDSGLPNTKGAGPIVDTQKDRADHFEKYVTDAVSHPNLVGYHWFEAADEPKEGRFDGENSNYGIVNINDEPYTELVTRMAQVNGQVEALHQKANVAP